MQKENRAMLNADSLLLQGEEATRSVGHVVFTDVLSHEEPGNDVRESLSSLVK